MNWVTMVCVASCLLDCHTLCQVVLPRCFHMKTVIVCPAARRDVSDGEVATQA
jgi:hypothetical protein